MSHSIPPFQRSTFFQTTDRGRCPWLSHCAPSGLSELARMMTEVGGTASHDELFVARVAAEDVVYVVDRLQAAAEAELDDLVRGVLLRGLLQEPVGDVL